MDLGLVLRSLRAERRLSQAEVAERAGISRKSYCKIELGRSRPKVETLLALARVLDVPIATLLPPAPPTPPAPPAPA